MEQNKTFVLQARAARRHMQAAACLGLALVLWAAGPARADSAVGVDTALGNALNPPGRSAVPRPLAADGYDTVRRSPSGQLYGLPLDVSGETSKTADGWEYSGGVDLGVLGGAADKKNALFRKYKDLKNGAYLDYFEVEADKADSASFVQAFGGGSGQHDQFYGLQFGRYNEWKVKLFYNETRHVYTDTWKSLFNGEGTGNQTTGLPAPTLYVEPAIPVQPTHTGGATAGGNTFVGDAAPWACTAAAPCWKYGTNIYSNATALAAVNGVIGTANPTTGIVATHLTKPPLTGATTTSTNAVQSNMALAISNKLAATNTSELSVLRQKGGARLDATLDNFWKGYASYTQEQRKGSRPFAMNEGNASFEVAEPIDYVTHDLLAGLQYADTLTQANLRASLSMFRNNISTLNVQYPLLNSTLPFGAIQTATYDLNPDNNALNLKAEFAQSLPDFYKGRFTAAVSWGTNRENDDLLPPISPAQNAQLAAANVTQFSGSTNVGYAAGTAWVNDWNTTQALSQTTAKQRIDNTLLDLGLSLKPIDDLNVKGSLRVYETVNKGGYMAYNKRTGQFGRGVADGNNANMDVIVGLAPGAIPGKAGSCYVPPGYSSIAACTFGLGTVANGANVPVFGQARSTRQTNYGLAADYDLTRSSSINAALEREEFKRNFRERDKTWEDKFKLGYVDRALENATLRVSFEDARKRGSDYRYRTFEDLGTGLPGLDIATQINNANTQGYAPFAPAGAPPAGAPPGLVGLFNRYSYYFRKYDQADRDQQVFNGRLNYLFREDMDIGLNVQMKTTHYPNSIYGLTKDNQNSGTLEFNYQPTSGETIYAFYSLQQGKKSANMNSVMALIPLNNTCTPAYINQYGYSACADNINGAGGSRPASDAWSSDTTDNNNVFGLGLQSNFGSLKFGLDYSYADSKTKISYAYGSNALNGNTNNQATLAAIAGSALPSMTFIQQSLTMNLLIPIDKRMSIRLFDRYETGKVKDWHYDGVITNAVAAYDSSTLLLDAGPQSYHTNIIGIFIQYKL